MLKSLLTIVSGGPDTATTVAASAALATACGARLAGLYVPPAKSALGDLVADTTEAMMIFHGGMPSALLQGEAATRPMTRLDLARQIFTDHGVATIDTAEAPDSPRVVALGRLNDLTMVARPGGDPQDPEPAAVNLALFSTGRPLLVVPPGPFPARFNRAVVVWNGSAEAARATRAALPLLQGCAEVVVLSLGASAAPADLCGYLALHGVSARGETIDGGGLSARARGRVVLRHAERRQADLLVMGAYGEGRMMRFLGLGGATAKVITACKVPLLLAH